MKSIKQQRHSGRLHCTVAYSSERLFQIESNIPVQFESEDDMMVYIWSNYNRWGDDNGYSWCNAKVYGS